MPPKDSPEPDDVNEPDLDVGREKLLSAAVNPDRSAMLSELTGAFMLLAESAPTDIESLAMRIAAQAFAWVNFATEPLQLSLLKLQGEALEKHQSGIREILEQAARLLNQNEPDPSEVKRRHTVLRAVDSSLNGYHDRDPRMLLDKIRIALDPHLSRQMLEQWEFTAEELSKAQAVIDAWDKRSGKWDALELLILALGLPCPSRRRGGTVTSGAVHPLSQEWQDLKNGKIGA